MNLSQIHELVSCENVTGLYSGSSTLRQAVNNSIQELFRHTHLLRLNSLTGEWEFNVNGVYKNNLLGSKKSFIHQQFFAKPADLKYESLGSGKECVYAIYSPSNRFDAAVGKYGYFPIKIGRTRNLNSRIKSLSASGPGMLAVGLVFRTDSASQLESSIHTYLGIRGRLIEIPGRREWFQTNLDEVKSVYKKLDGRVRK